MENTRRVIDRWHGAAGGRLHVALASPYLFGRHVEHRRNPHRLPDASDAAAIHAPCADDARASRRRPASSSRPTCSPARSTMRSDILVAGRLLACWAAATSWSRTPTAFHPPTVRFWERPAAGSRQWPSPTRTFGTAWRRFPNSCKQVARLPSRPTARRPTPRSTCGASRPGQRGTSGWRAGLTDVDRRDAAAHGHDRRGPSPPARPPDRFSGSGQGRRHHRR